MNRKEFLEKTSIASTSLLLLNGCNLFNSSNNNIAKINTAVNIKSPKENEDVFQYILREKGNFDITLYRQILGAANTFKEGDKTIHVAALNRSSRNNARQLLAATKIKDLSETVVFKDEIEELIKKNNYTK